PITILFLIIFVGTENPEIIQLTKDSKFKLEGFIIRDTYILNGTERFVIASQVTDDKSTFEGLRLLFVKKDKIEFKSKDVGESYIYRPTFYKFKDSSLLIACELGFEYSLGVDIFEFRQGKITEIGNLDIASNTDEIPTTIVPNMKIEKKFGDQYHFKFAGPTVINPEGSNETKIAGELITGIYMKETGKISLMIRK
ncbi:MAG: hypothetical protein C0490_07515, partial [Marivirga sp.]|nr:hypothetical protein [Marivirga sp.]